MIDLEAFSRELTRKFGEDAAQHALMRVVEKGWHENPGANEVERFAKVCAHHYKITEKVREGKRDEMPELVQRADALELAAAREELLAMDPLFVDAHFWGQEEAARIHRIARATVGTRIHRRKLASQKVKDQAHP